MSASQRPIERLGRSLSSPFGGKRGARHRFQTVVDHRPAAGLPPLESGVALRFPPHSKMRVRVPSGIFDGDCLLLVVFLCVIVSVELTEIEEHCDYESFDFQIQHDAAS